MYAFLPVGEFALGNWPEDPAPADRHGGQAKKPKKPAFSSIFACTNKLLLQDRE